MDLKLKDKVAVITGPAKGMGAAISMGFAQEGAHLALLGRDTAAIAPVCKAARALGGRREKHAHSHAPVCNRIRNPISNRRGCGITFGVRAEPARRT